MNHIVCSVAAGLTEIDVCLTDSVKVTAEFAVAGEDLRPHEVQNGKGGGVGSDGRKETV
jgi:hypothetical protein